MLEDEMKTSNKLVLKDLVNIGLLQIIYFVLMFAVGTPLGFLVITYMAFPFVAALICGVVGMYLLAKVQKPWALFIFAILPGIVMTVMGHSPVVLVHSIIVGGLAELVRWKMGYSSIKSAVISYATMSLWFVGSLLQIYLVSDAYYKLSEQMMGAEYANELLALPAWWIPILYVTAFIGGILGGLFGAKILKKHFKKAGMQ